MSHAIVLRPSGSKQWTECTAAPRYVAALDAQGKLDPDTGSAAAAEGTKAHKVASDALESPDPLDYLASDWVADIPDDMIRHVRGYVTYCLATAGRSDYAVELAVPLYYQPDEVGTVDFWSYNRGTKTLKIVDLKYGAGVRVDSVGNTQLAIYAKSTADVVGGMIGEDIDRVTITVYQPRVGDGEPVTWVVDRDELEEIAEGIGIIAGAILGGADGEFSPSEDTCRWCRAQAICPARAEVVLGLEVMDSDIGLIPEPESLTDDQLSRIVTDAAAIERFIRDVRKYVRAKVEAGDGARFGLKLVEGKLGNRVWADESAARDWLSATLPPGVPLESPGKLITAPAAEKALKAARVAKSTVAEIASMVNRPRQAAQMVPTDDPRPAIGEGDFANLEDGE